MIHRTMTLPSNPPAEGKMPSRALRFELTHALSYASTLTPHFMPGLVLSFAARRHSLVRVKVELALMSRLDV